VDSRPLCREPSAERLFFSMIEHGRRLSSICVAILVVVSTLSYGQSATDDGSADLLRNPPSVRNHMLRESDSSRSRLQKKGVAFDLYYISDFLGNSSGGHDQVMTDWGRVRGIVDIDLGKLTGTHAPTFHVTGVWQYGHRPRQSVPRHDR
jgi:carbohydrate-selective porin OprB